jgi:hypothetical protein
VRSIAASGTFTFPIGPTASTYNPLTITLGGSDPTETFTVSVSNSVNPAAPDNTTAVQRTWTISEESAGSNNAQLAFQWLAVDEGASFTRTNCSIWRHDGANWVELDTPNVSGSDPYVGTSVLTNISTFGSFLIGNSGALPVQLVSFAVKAGKSGAILYWSTATETNNYGFEIERRSVGLNTWQRIGFVAGAGTSSSVHEYSFTDRTVAPGRYAYRLKQVDNDGTFTFSGAAEVEIGLAAREFKLESNYPNPFNPTTTIEFTLAEDGRALLRVYNMLGQEVAKLFDGEAQAGRVQRVKFDASGLPSGLYFAKLEAGKQQMMRKMMLMK